MNRKIVATTLALSLGFGVSAFAQSPAVGGPDAKGNAPVKAVHTVNDGSAKPGANSFTEGQARQHILNSGYTGVSGLSKGKDGVWRGMATHNGAQVAVAMDFKGNVSEATSTQGTSSMGSGSMGTSTTTTTRASSAQSTSGGGDEAGTSAAMSGGDEHHHAMRHHHHRRHMRSCTDPRPNGAACSGIDRNHNGVSDKEDRAINAGAHP